MHARRFALWLVMLFGALVASSQALAPQLVRAAADAAKNAERPNVVIIYADDLGYGDLGCYGHPKFQTPHLDQMAREGAKLTHFYSSCGYCAPARGSLMTGRYPFRCGMVRNPHPLEDYGGSKSAEHDNMGLPLDEITLGQAFHDAGYRTACVGKWHLGHKPHFYPTRRGFDEYFGLLYSNDMHPVELFENEKRVEFPVEQTTLTQRYTAKSLAFIEQNKDRPFFLYLPHTMPHKPLAASPEFYGKSGAGLYGDALAELDWSVGQVLAKLCTLGLDRRTLVFFSSDNGPWYGGSTGGLRGMKARWWEGGIRVPLLAWWPGQIPGGHVSAQPAIIMDLFATSLKAAGITPPQDRTIDGRDILPLLTSQASTPHEAIFSFQDSIRTVRAGKWKLHQSTTGIESLPANWVDPRAPNGTTILAQKEQYGPRDYPGINTGDTSKTPALFDLEADPAEQHNVADKHPEIVQKLTQLAAQTQAAAQAERAKAAKPKPEDAKTGAAKSDVAVYFTAHADRPRVLILGDSISLGYTPVVKKNLEAQAEVLRPAENCQHSAHGLAKVKTWLGKGKWDVIHFNFGIWDTHMIGEEGNLLRDEANYKGKMHIRHTPEQYRDNLAKILDILEPTGAKLIFANTTPIMSRTGDRFEDVKKHNAAAEELMKSRGVTINNLYDFVLPNARAWQTGDKVHFNATGNEQLGKRVSEAILQAIPQPAR